MGLKETILRFKEQYTVDQRELGKILIVASITLLFFSSYTVITLRSSAQQLGEAGNDLNQLSKAINSKKFNSSLEAIEDVRTTTIGDKFQYAASTFRATQGVVNTYVKASNEFTERYKTYQWLVLIAILGLVAGITLLYI
jgi:general stress protein CsbA